MRRLQLVVQLELLRLPTAELQLMRRRLRWRRLLPVLARMRPPRLLGVQQELQAARSDGLLMCGAAPKQAKFDWRSTLKFASEDVEDGNDVAGEAG